MVKKSEWSDEQLERLLRQLPKIKDERDPQDIYQNISRRTRKRRSTFWAVPAAAAIAAVLLLFILIPGLTGQQFQESADKAVENKGEQASSGGEPSEKTESSYDTARKSEDSSDGEAGVQDASESEQAETEIEDDGKAGLASIEEEESDYRTALYEEDIEGQTILTYAVPDANIQTLVPVSVLTAPDEGKTEFDLYKETMEKLTEEEWGLGEAYPIPQAELFYDPETETLTADLKEDAEFSGSATEVLFKSLLTNNLDSLDAKTVLLTTEGEPGAEYGNTGAVDSFTVEEDQGNHAYYFLYTNPQSPPFIVPGEESYSSIQEALEAMKVNKETLGLEPSIPSDMNIKSGTESAGEGSELTLTLEEGTKFEDNAASSYTIEAILLMAKGFNYSTVKLDNAEIEKVGNFLLQEALNVPAAPNLRQLP